MSQRELILTCLQALIGADPFFPAAELDAPEPQNWRKAIPGVASALQDHVTVQDGPIEVTRDGGAENEWELELEAAVVYAIAGADQRERRSRRDQATAHVAAIVRTDRTLGTGDPQVYAEVRQVERDDDLPIKAAAPVALIRLTIAVQFIADSPAG